AGVFDYEITTLVCAYGFTLARHYIGFNPGKWFGRGTRFSLCRARNRRDHDRPGFGLPPGVDYWTGTLADNLVIPHPRFRIYGFANCAQQTQTREVVFERPLFAPLDERADGCWRCIENVYAMSLDEVPETIRLGMVWRAFIHQNRGA